MPHEGRLAITRFDPERDTYSVSFAPDQREQPGAGAVGYDVIRGLDGVREYLLRQNKDEDTIKNALQELRQNGRCYIPHVSSDC
jgi:hypothetical protein